MPVLTSDQRFRAYAAGGDNVLLLFQRGSTLETVRMPGGTIPPHDGHGPLHIAFAVSADDLPAWETRLAERGIEIEGRTGVAAGRPQHLFSRPGRSPVGIGHTRAMGGLLRDAQAPPIQRTRNGCLELFASCWREAETSVFTAGISSLSSSR